MWGTWKNVAKPFITVSVSSKQTQKNWENWTLIWLNQMVMYQCITEFSTFFSNMHQTAGYILGLCHCSLQNSVSHCVLHWSARNQLKRYMTRNLHLFFRKMLMTIKCQIGIGHQRAPRTSFLQFFIFDAVTIGSCPCSTSWMLNWKGHSLHNLIYFHFSFDCRLDSIVDWNFTKLLPSADIHWPFFTYNISLFEVF